MKTKIPAWKTRLAQYGVRFYGPVWNRMSNCLDGTYVKGQRMDQVIRELQQQHDAALTAERVKQALVIDQFKAYAADKFDQWGFDPVVRDLIKDAKYVDGEGFSDGAA